MRSWSRSTCEPYVALCPFTSDSSGQGVSTEDREDREDAEQSPLLTTQSAEPSRAAFRLFSNLNESSLEHEPGEMDLHRSRASSSFLSFFFFSFFSFSFSFFLSFFRFNVRKAAPMLHLTPLLSSLPKAYPPCTSCAVTSPSPFIFGIVSVPFLLPLQRHWRVPFCSSLAPQ